MSEENKDKQDKPENKSRVILYIGTDERFRDRLNKRFLSTYPAIEWEFMKMSTDQSDPVLGIQSLFNEIVKCNPRIIYFDYSQGDSKDLQFLVELIARDNFFKEIPICGLVDKKEKTLSSECADVDLVFVKGAETFDVINTPMSIAFPKAVKPVQFAKAKISKKAMIADEFRLGYLTESVAHIESNLPLTEEDIVTLQTEIPNKFVPSKKFKVKRKSPNDLYYNFKFGYDLTYLFADPPTFDDKNMSTVDHNGRELSKVELIKKARDEREQAKNEHKSKVEWCKKKHKEWIQFNANDTGQKGTKILVIDKSMRILSDQSTGDVRKQPFAFRFQTELSDSMNDIVRVRPILIAYQMFSRYKHEEQGALKKALEILKMPEDERPPRNLLAETEEERLMNQMVEELPEYIREEQRYVGSILKRIKEIDSFKPVVLLYNTHDMVQSKGLQQSYQYDLVSTKDDSIELDSVIKLASLLEKKRKEKHDKVIEKKIAVLKKSNPQKFRAVTAADFDEKRYYIKKNNPLSFGRLEAEVVIKAMTESELLFSTNMILPLKSYRMNYPIPMSIYLVSIDGAAFITEGDSKTYRALIHSIDEHDKMKLREEVNKVFFAPLMEQREKENAEYWEKHEKARSMREDGDEEDHSEGDQVESVDEDKPQIDKNLE